MWPFCYTYQLFADIKLFVHFDPCIFCLHNVWRVALVPFVRDCFGGGTLILPSAMADSHLYSLDRLSNNDQFDFVQQFFPNNDDDSSNIFFDADDNPYVNSNISTYLMNLNSLENIAIVAT